MQHGSQIPLAPRHQDDAITEDMNCTQTAAVTDRNNGTVLHHSEQTSRNESKQSRRKYKAQHGEVVYRGGVTFQKI